MIPDSDPVGRYATAAPAHRLEFDYGHTPSAQDDTKEGGSS